MFEVEASHAGEMYVSPHREFVTDEQGEHLLDLAVALADRYVGRERRRERVLREFSAEYSDG